MGSFFEWVETTWIATTVGSSSMLTGTLSSVHLIGFTLVTGGALVANLRLMGWLFADRPLREVTAPTHRGIEIGLFISVVTGVMLFAPRAAAAVENDTFRLKMLLLAAAAVLHFALHRRLGRRAGSAPGVLKAAGALGLALWMGVALAGCAYILFE